MNLITRVTPLGLGRWLCEVFVVGGERIAYAETPKGLEFMRPTAESFVKSMALLCKNIPPGKYSVHPLYDEWNPLIVYPQFVLPTAAWVATEKIGEANLPRQEGEHEQA